MVCEWSFETASRAESVLSGAVPFITKRLFCGDAWCCYCVAQEGRSASLTLNSTNVADCSHKVMKTDSHSCHSAAADNMYIVLCKLAGELTLHFVVGCALMYSHK